MERNNTDASITNEYKPWLVIAILLVSDFLSLTFAFFIPYFIRRLLLPVMGGEVSFAVISPVLWGCLSFVLILFISKNLYPGDLRTGVTEFKEIFNAVSIAYIALGVSLFLFGIGPAISRFVFLASWLFACFFVFLARAFLHNRLSVNSWWNRPVILIGPIKDIPDIVTRFQKARRMAIKPVCILITDDNSPITNIDGIPVFVNSEEDHLNLKKNGIDTVVYVSHSGETTKKQKEQLHSISLIFSRLIYVLANSPISTLSMKPIDVEGRAALQVKYNLLSPVSALVKRIVDLILSLLISFFAFPLFLVITFLIRLDSPGLAIYKQKRIGKNGRIFEIYKFRTMIDGAESKLPEIFENDEKLREEYSNFHKLKVDPRITRIGQFLRKTSLDELPQLWNVLRGEMSLVGPRAYLESELINLGEYTQIIQRVSPGLTGWWQVMGRQNVDFKSRLAMDEYYISNFSLWMDFYIMIKTFWVILGMKGT